jgi:hypothetical protein
MKTTRFLVLLGMIMLEVGCGLPDTYYLQPPTVVTLAPNLGQGQFIFSNPTHDLNSDINVNFTGDELYYKFYSNIINIEQNAYDSTNTSDPSVQLLAKGFFPIVAGTDSPPNRLDPVIPIGGASTVTVTIVTNGASTYSSPSGPTGEIRRDIANVTYSTIYKDFETNASSINNYIVTDADVASMPFSGGLPVYVAMYALSFGYTGASTPQRSVPTYLGYIQISVFP